MELYSPREIAQAAGVSTHEVGAAVGGDRFVRHEDAVRIGRALMEARRAPFALFTTAAARRRGGVPLAVSGAIHTGFLVTAIIIATLGLTPRAASIRLAEDPVEDMRLVFLATPGPGGGGGGGGLLQKPAPPKARREGRSALSSPLPLRQPPKPVQPVLAPLTSEPLPVVIAPIVRAPADDRDRGGVLQQSRTETDSHGSGQGGGTGTGGGTGVGSGDGAGIGPGSGGGTGGGPYRPGSGIAAPRLLKEVRGDYTDEARRAGLAGDVVLELVVRRDGTVGDVKVLEGLGGGLNERAIQAVRQWRFAPATRQGVPVDVIVEVAMEFKLR